MRGDICNLRLVNKNTHVRARRRSRSRAKRMDSNSNVTLHRQHHALVMQPPCPDVLGCLRSVEHTLVSAPRHGSYLKALPKMLSSVQTAAGDNHNVDVPSGITMAGLEPVVHFLLREKGYSAYNRTRVARLPEPDRGALEKHGVVDDDVLALLRHHSRGLVRLGPNVDRAWLIAEIALTHADRSIVVAAARIKEARAIASALRRWLPEDVMLIRADRLRRDRRRVAVGTYTGLMGGCMDLRRRELVIALDAVEALGRRGVELLGGVGNARLYGFLPHGLHVAPRDGDHLRGFFGFEEVHLPAHGHRPLPVDVVFETVAGGDAWPADLAGIALRRRAVWHNGLFNRRGAVPGFVALFDEQFGGRPTRQRGCQ